MAELTGRHVRSAAREAWGEVQTCRQLPGLRGVYEVMTAGHGGYLVSDELFDLHPILASEQFAGASWRSNATGQTVITFYEFEEDVAWALLAATHLDILTAINAVRARDGQDPLTHAEVVEVAERWYPELLAELRAAGAVRP